MNFIPRKLYAKIIWQILRKWTFKLFQIDFFFLNSKFYKSEKKV